MCDDQLNSLILDALDDAVALLDADGSILSVNAAWRRAARGVGDLSGSNIGPGDNYLAAYHDAAQAGDTWAEHIFAGIQAVRDGQQVRFQIADPHDLNAMANRSALHAVRLAPDDQRVVVLHPAASAEPADLPQAEMLAILSQAEAVAHIGSWKWDFATNRVTWSGEMFRIFGIDPATFDGDLDAIIAHAIHPDDRERVRAANAQVIATQAPAPLEYRIRRPSGEERVVYGDGQVVRDAANQPTAILGSLHDRTELKRAEAALLIDDRRLNALFDLSERATALSEPEIIQLALEHAVTLTSSHIGYLHSIEPDQRTIQCSTWSHTAFTQRVVSTDGHDPIGCITTWGDDMQAKRPMMHNDLTQAADWHRFPDGHAPQGRHLSVPLLDAQNRVMLVIRVGEKAQDYDAADARQLRLLADSLWKILQRTRAEAQLRLLSAALEAAATPIVITDCVGVIEWVNPAYTALTGYTAAEAIGQNPRLLKSDKHPTPFYAKMWATILAGKVWHGEMTNRHKDGHLYDEEQTITPVRDATGQIAHFIAIKQDISQRKQWEYEQLARTTLSAELGSAATRADMGTIMLRRTADLLGATDVGVAIATLATGELTIEQAGGVWSAAAGERIAMSGSLIGEALANNRALVRAATAGEPCRPALLDALPALACVPLSVSHDPFGALLVGRAQPLSAAEQRMLISIAEIASNALHRATLHEQTERHLQRMHALHRIDKAISAGVDMEFVLSIVLDELSAQLHMDAIAVLRAHHSLPNLERVAARGFRSHRWPQIVRLGESLAGQVALKRNMVTHGDLSALGSVETGLMREEGFVCFVGIPLIAKGHLKGILELFGRTPHHGTDEWRNTLDLFSSQLAIALDNADMVERLQRSHAELMHAYETTIEGWSRALELRDKETEGHTLRVTEMTLRLARAMEVSEDELIHIRRGALLHDIGKMGVPDHILLKPGPLTEAECAIMRQHPVYAYEMLAPIAFLDQALAIPYAHHERYDGSGYPCGLTGQQIPLAARIFAVVDVWDALRSDRPYRSGWPEARVHAYLQEGAGQLFDPHAVAVFLHMLGG